MKKHKPEQIVTLLRQVEVEIAKGKTTPQVCKEAEITDQSYYRWRKVTSTSGNATVSICGTRVGVYGAPLSLREASQRKIVRWIPSMCMQCAAVVG